MNRGTFRAVVLFLSFRFGGGGTMGRTGKFSKASDFGFCALQIAGMDKKTRQSNIFAVRSLSIPMNTAS